jgi:predicted lysophospholipase L1 biosynthesis ABC-type transport system permease subunit
VVATLVTIAMGWLLGVNVDSGSATLYLIPPTVVWFLSPCLADPDARRGPYPFAFALAFAAAALSLVLIGILPVTRLGVVMAVGLAASAGAAAAGTWLWEPIRMAYDSLRRK